MRGERKKREKRGGGPRQCGTSPGSPDQRSCIGAAALERDLYLRAAQPSPSPPEMHTLRPGTTGARRAPAELAPERREFGARAARLVRAPPR